MKLHQYVANLLTAQSRRRRQSPDTSLSVLSIESLETRSLLTSLIGSEITISGTFQSSVPGSGTGGVEIPVGEPQRVTVEQSLTDPEVTRFLDSWNIDIDGDRIAIVFDHDPSVTPDPSGTIAAGTFHRFYFDVSGLADGEFISSVSPEPSRNLVPTVRLIDSDTILVEIGPGMDLGPGSNALITVGVGNTPRSIIGQDFSVSNTIQSALGTSGIEIRTAIEAGVIVSGPIELPELIEFNNTYDIDIENTSITMTFNLSPRVPDPSRVIEAGTFDRYYFFVRLGDNVAFSSAAADPSQNLVPNVSIDSSGLIVVEIGPGMQIGNGFDAVINFEVAVTGSVVTGQKWNDLNNDGVQQPGEEFLNGWEIQLKDLLGNVVASTFTRNIDLDDDGVIDPTTEKGVYRFEGVQDGTYSVEEVLKPGWVPSHPASPVDELADQLNRTYGLVPSNSEFLNWGGQQDKWVFGNTGWFYILPDGKFYQWNRSASNNLMGTFLGQLDANVYNDLSLLYNAEAPVRNIADVQIPNDITGVNFGNYIPAPTFTLQELAAGQARVLDINWTEVAPNLNYDVWVTDINTRRRFGDVHTVSGNNLQVTVPERDYRVWMRTQADHNVWSAWSASQEIEFLRTPVEPITAGLDAGIDGTPTIQWNALQVPNPSGVVGAPALNATSYDLRVTDPQGKVTYQANGITGTSHRVATIHPLGNHYVSVRGNYSDGSRNDWSMGQRLVISGRPAISMNNGVISWVAVKAANEYEIWVDRNDDNGNRVTRQLIYANDIKELSYTLPGNLERGKYSAWVRAIRAEGGAEYNSFWSNRLNFVVDRLGIAANETNQLPSAQIQLISLQAEAQTPDDVVAVRPTTPAVDSADETPEVAEARTETAQPETSRLVAAVMEELAESDLLDHAG